MLCWVLVSGPLDSLSFLDLVVNVLNSKGYFLLKREELERGLPNFLLIMVCV